MDRKSLATIRLSLAASIVINIKSETTTKRVIDVLERMYERAYGSSIAYLMKKLFTMKMEEGGDITTHVSEFNTVTDELMVVGIKFDDEVRVIVVMMGLPENRESYVMTVSNSSGGILIFNDVVGMLPSENNRRNTLGLNLASGSALNVDGRDRSSNRGDR